MAPKPKKSELLREPARNLPTPGDDNRATLASILEASSFDDTTFTELDLSNQKIAALKGSNLLFDRVSFANCEIATTRLSDVRFTHCDLSNAQLRSFEATRVEFIDCRLVGLNALACRWQDVLLQHCDARFAQLSEGRIRRSEITNSQLREAALTRVDLEGTRFHESVLSHAELTGTKLAGIDLRTTDIEAILLHLEDLRGAIVSPAQAMDLARLLEVIIR
jgi:uncharacterized protein YjbI with pentapeptide repeats